MIWATVNSQSGFCWLYRASPSLAAENIINLILVDHLVMSMCIIFSCVVGKVCLLWPGYSLFKTLISPCPTHSVLQGQICWLFQVFLHFLLCIPVPYNEKDIFGGISSWRSCRSSQNHSTSASSAHQQKIGLKIYWAWPCLSEQDPLSPQAIYLIRNLS